MNPGFACKAKVTWSLIWPRNMHVVLVPLLVFAGLLALGISGVVIWGLNASADTAKFEAQSTLRVAAETMESTFAKALNPLRQGVKVIKLNPTVSRVVDFWYTYGGFLLEGAPNGAGGIGFQFQGYFLIGKSNDFGIQGGDDLLAENSTLRAQVLATMVDGPVLAGPYKPTPESQDYLTFSESIWMTNVAENETWGLDKTPTKCPTGLCYRPDTRTKWWGGVSYVCPARSLIHDSLTIQGLQSQYNVQLWKPNNPTTSSTSRRTKVALLTTNDTYPTQPSDAQCQTMQVLDQKWELCIWKESWSNNNLRYLYILVVLVSLAVSIMLFLTLLAWVENRAMLHSVLPRETIKRMKTDTTLWANTSFTDQFYAITIETPAQLMLSIIQSCLNNIIPDIPKLLAVRTALQQTANVYQPTQDAMRAQMLEAQGLDDEVVAHLLGDAPGVRRRHTEDGCDSATPIMTQTDVTDHNDNTPCSIDIVDIANSHFDSGSASSIDDAGVRVSVPDKAALETTSDVDNGENLDGRHSEHLPLPKSLRTMLSTQIDTVLQGVDDWSFDPFALEAATQGHPLSVLGFYLIRRAGLTRYAGMDSRKLVRFLRHVEEGCGWSNPYHYCTHSADVLQTMHILIHRGGLMPHYMDNITMLACYIAAIIHDYGHVGRNNDFLKNSRHELAITYNDRCPMESHSVAAVFRLLTKRKELDFLSGLSKDVWEQLRELVISLVLSTDMKQHFSFVGQFNAQHHDSQQQTQAITKRASIDTSHASGAGAEPIMPVNDGDKLLSLQLALKCADLRNLAAPLEVYKHWVKRLEDEFFLQGDDERAAGLPISPLCDRTKDGVSKSQVGFFDFVAVPLFKAFTGRFTATSSLLRGAMENRAYWNTVRVSLAGVKGDEAGARPSPAGTKVSSSRGSKRNTVESSDKYGS